MKKRDYHARLVVYDLPNLDKWQLMRLKEWLKSMQVMVSQADKYSVRVVCRLFKRPGGK
jgi:predicted alpha/beta hydrolase family esterase